MHRFSAHQERRVLVISVSDTINIDLPSHIVGFHGTLVVWKASKPVRSESDQVLVRDTMTELCRLPKCVPLASPTKC
jgi:hypothetical protein